MSTFELLDPWDIVNTKINNIYQMLRMFNASFIDCESSMNPAAQRENMSEAIIGIFDYIKYVEEESTQAFEAAFNNLVKKANEKGEKAA